MKRTYFLLMFIGLWVIIGCQGDAFDEQSPAVTAVVMEDTTEVSTDAEVTEVVIGEIAAVLPTPELVIMPITTTTTITTSVDSSIMMDAEPDGVNPFVTLHLKFETDGAMAVRNFDIIKYEFVDGVLDDWIGEASNNGQPWVALGWVLAAPYDADKPTEPRWVVIKSDDMPDTALFWEESANGELLEELPIFETVTLNGTSDFETLLQARNGYYLPEVNGILWIERLVLKTGDTTGEEYYFSPDNPSPVDTDSLFTFICENTVLRCVWTYQYEINSYDSQEFTIMYKIQDFNQEAKARSVIYLTTDSGHSLDCDIETAVCFDEEPYHFDCDFDNDTCTYEHLYEAKSQVFTLISDDSDWNEEDEVDFQDDYDFSTTCNWDRLECLEFGYHDPTRDPTGDTSGTSFESRQCGLILCPDGYFCKLAYYNKLAHYNKYQCSQHDTPRPQR